MDIILDKSAILNFIIAFVALLFMILVSIQITLNKILRELKEIRIIKSKREYKEVRGDERD